MNERDEWDGCLFTHLLLGCILFIFEHYLCRLFEVPLNCESYIKADFFSFHSIKAPLLVIYFYGCVCDSSHPFGWWSHYITIKPKRVRYRPKSTAKLKCHQQKPNKQRNNRMLYPYHRIGYSNNKLRYKLVFVCASHSLLPYFIMNVFLHHFSWFSLGIKSHEKLCRYSKVYFSDTGYRCVYVYGKWYIKSFFYSVWLCRVTNVCA